MSSQKTKFKIILADDHKILRLGLTNLIARNEDLEIIDEASNGKELLEKLKTKKCDLIILDLSMPDMTGIEVLTKLKEIKYKGKVLIFTMHKEQQMFKHALKKGAHGYILKDDNFDRILDAIKDIRAGRKAFSSELNAYLLQEFDQTNDMASFEMLTRREKEVLCMIATGETSKEIADDLCISFRTVQTHRANIMEKLDIHNTAGIVKFAIDQGLV